MLLSAGVVALRMQARNRRLTSEVLEDALTGVGNRRSFERYVSGLTPDARFAVVMIDFDRFKELNDRHGHAAGDQALIRVARGLRSTAQAMYGKRARVYRLGGDEFMMVLEGADSLHAAAAVERVREGVSMSLQSHERQLTISCGIACAPEHAVVAGELVSYADRALYQAKRGGRNRSVVYSHAMFDAETRRDGNMMLRTLADALAAAVDAKDAYTHAHSHNVADLSLYLAQAMGLSSEQIEEIALGGLLHDIGKIGVADRVLNKPGRLTDDEWRQIQAHTEIGYTILSGIDGAEAVREMVLYHHERPDGSGYPRGLSGDEIPIGARIISVADAFDSMTAERVYSTPRTPDEAILEIVRLRGIQFHPDVVDAFCELMVYDLEAQTGTKPEDADAGGATPSPIGGTAPDEDAEQVPAAEAPAAAATAAGATPAPDVAAPSTSDDDADGASDEPLAA
jgi:diguanylate cyclase (GGDEF)-like protein/putative nucleotidyltransferase with HDIG domain